EDDMPYTEKDLDRIIRASVRQVVQAQVPKIVKAEVDRALASYVAPGPGGPGVASQAQVTQHFGNMWRGKDASHLNNLDHLGSEIADAKSALCRIESEVA